MSIVSSGMDRIPVIQYSYSGGHHWILEPPADVGNYTYLNVMTPDSGSPIRLEPGKIHYIRTGIRIHTMPVGFRFRIENSPNVKEAPFYIVEYSHRGNDDLHIKIISMRNMELDPRRPICQIVVEPNPIILSQNISSTHTAVSMSFSEVSGSGSDSDSS
jgi:hypothetical protein